MIIIRFILICLIVYLLVRGFIRSFQIEDPHEGIQQPSRKEKVPKKKVSKEVGEYVDYEEVE